MQLQEAIGGTIRQLRKERKLSLRQLTPYVSIGHLSDIERGNKEASTHILELIAEGLNLSTSQLLLEIYNYLEGDKNA